MQKDALVFERAPQAFNKDVVQIAALAAHRYPHARPVQAVCPSKRRELGPLMAVHDVGRPEAVDRVERQPLCPRATTTLAAF